MWAVSASTYVTMTMMLCIFQNDLVLFSPEHVLSSFQEWVVNLYLQIRGKGAICTLEVPGFRWDLTVMLLHWYLMYSSMTTSRWAHNGSYTTCLIALPSVLLCDHIWSPYVHLRCTFYLFARICIIYVSITIVQSYTENYHKFVVVVLLRVQSMSNNAKGNKRVICFRYSFVAMVILILSYKRGISLHVPLPMNVVNARCHNLLGDAISFLVSNSSR